MEVNSSFERIEKFNGSLGIIFLREFKTTFSTMVCELEFEYGTNYPKVFTFKQLAHYLLWGIRCLWATFPRILGATQIFNLVYATAIATAFQVALQAAIAHHGIVPNNPNLVPTLVNLSPQQFIVATTNIPPTIDAPSFSNPVGEFFRVLELEFLVKNFEKIL